MGEVVSVMGLSSGIEMADANILKVINPSASDRAGRAARITNPIMPPLEEWRFANPAGKRFDATHVIRSNFFKVDTSSIIGRLCQYGVHVFNFNKSTQEFDTADICHEEDSRVLSSLLLELKRKHPEWGVDGTPTGVGFTYDGRSNVVTSADLPLQSTNDSGQPFHSELIVLKNIDGSDSRKRYKVEITKTLTIDLPGPSIEEWQALDETALIALDSPLLSFARWGLVEEHPEWFTVGSKVFAFQNQI